jgi:hypothetical protein
MTAPMPPRLLHGTRLQVDLAQYFPPLLQDIPVRASNICNVNSQF